MDQAIVVLTNLPDEDSARALARRLVEQRLAACVNILPGVQSIYRWQGQLEEARETSLSIKTTASRYPELEAAIRAHHPYDVPEIVALPVTHGWHPYLEWIAGETDKVWNA